MKTWDNADLFGTTGYVAADQPRTSNVLYLWPRNEDSSNIVIANIAPAFQDPLGLDLGFHLKGGIVIESTLDNTNPYAIAVEGRMDSDSAWQRVLDRQQTPAQPGTFGLTFIHWSTNLLGFVLFPEMRVQVLERAESENTIKIFMSTPS